MKADIVNKKIDNSSKDSATNARKDGIMCAGEPECVKYDDIIDLPHHVSKDRPHMSMSDRAAQFAPFAALTGHDEAVRRMQGMVEETVENEIKREDIL